MAQLDCHTDPTPYLTLDPGRKSITLHAHPMHLKMDLPEAGRVSMELIARLTEAQSVNGVPIDAALAGLAVKGAELAEMSEA